MTVPRKIAVTALVLLPVGLLLAVLFQARQEPASSPAAASSSKDTASTVHELASLEAELKKKPDHAPILLRMAELHQKAGNPSAAVTVLRKAAAADPKNPDANLELGRSLFEANDPQGAIAATKQILEHNPKHVDALYNLGAIYGNLGDDATAQQYFMRAVEAGATSGSGQKAKIALDQIAKGTAAPASTGTGAKMITLPVPIEFSNKSGQRALPPNHPPLPPGHPVIPPK